MGLLEPRLLNTCLTKVRSVSPREVYHGWTGKRLVEPFSGDDRKLNYSVNQRGFDEPTTYDREPG
jgi:hypothetical protein